MTTYAVPKRVVNWDVDEEPVAKPVPPPPVVPKKTKAVRKRRSKAPPGEVFDIKTTPDDLEYGITDAPRSIVNQVPWETAGTPAFKVFPRTGAYYRGS